jgi:UDP-2,4-diacetamido-2,4,6-trideoxy-beta-L-altropyranose hydrolase
VRVIFRTDASIQIGAGHIMRCLTLAKALRQHGAICSFICRDHPGSLIELVKQHGFDVQVLHSNPEWKSSGVGTVHAEWLGAEWKVDAAQSKVSIGGEVVDWLIIDHYALDIGWESAMASVAHNLMVIDDLADRPHSCNLLLDQTLGRDLEDYRHLVPGSCSLLCGTKYALLRPEFAALRSYSLERRARPVLRELLISMGGVDKDNATSQVLEALQTCLLPADFKITVVMGATAPFLDIVRELAQEMPWPTQVLTNVDNMAQLMADSDLAIGAAGMTSWERCCLGLPTIMLVLAENQRGIAKALFEAGAACLVDASKLGSQLFIIPEDFKIQSLTSMSQAAAILTDGFGTEKVVQSMINKVKHAN